MLRDNLVEDCDRESNFKSIIASDREVASAQRTADGDTETGKYYLQTAERIRGTIPMPNHFEGKRGQRRIDRLRGCKKAFPAPVPFVE